MLTIFATPKPFDGHINVIQRNALQSWLRLDPNVEIILFGDEPGAAEICAEFGLRHHPEVLRSETGTKYVAYLFERAQTLASHAVVCYSNCDIILPSSFRDSVARLASRKKPFLMVGRRWDTNITDPIAFEDPQWEAKTQFLAKAANKRQTEWFADYFAFTRGLYRDLPGLVIGRNYWDNWLIWRAHSLGAAVVDATEAVTAIHQNHDYGYHPGGRMGVHNDAQTQQNFAIGEKGKHLRTIASANYKLGTRGLRPSPFAQLRYTLIQNRKRYWYKFLAVSRPIRHPLKTLRGH